MNLTKKHCVPCEGGMPPFTPAQEQDHLAQVDGWKLHTNDMHNITKRFEFATFMDAIEFVNQVARLAESEGHHPDMTIHFNTVTLKLFTHAIGGLSENDFIVAAKVDKMRAERENTKEEL
jgi:4a-hydroxytetrahydrobiopterin dehydratase